MLLAGAVAEGSYRAGGGGGTVAYVTTASACDASFSGAITTSAVNTTGANFLVAVLDCYDSNGTVTITDSKSNTWHLAASGATGQSYNQLNKIYYAYNTSSVGSGHTFTNTVTGGSGDGCPGIVVMAFSGMPTTNSHETPSGSGATGPWNQANGATSLISCYTAQTPLHTGDLCIAGMSGTQKGGGGITINSSFTIGAQLGPAASNGIAGAYLICASTSAVNPTWANLPASGVTNTVLVIFSNT